MAGAGYRGAAARVVSSLFLLFLMSQFYRATNAVLAPVFRDELGLSASQLGVLTGAFYAAFALAQIPVGVFLDRFGPRRTIAVMMLVPALGAFAVARAGDAAGLALGQAIMGAGCAVALSGAMVLFTRWFAPERFATMIALFSGLGNVGILLSATPFAVAVERFGWRPTFDGLAVLNVVLVAQMVFFVRDAPPGQVERTDARETFGAVVRGAGAVAGTRAIWPLLPLAFTSLSMVLVIRALWAGPYLADVYGLDAIERGNVLLLYTIAMLAGNVAIGPLDRVFRSRKRIVFVAAGLTAAALALLAALPRPGLWATIALFCLDGLACNYIIVIYAQARGFFPLHRIGRVVTLINGVNVAGIAILQVASGGIVRAFPAVDGVAPDLAYRAMFGTLAVILCLAILIYSLSEDRPGEARRS